MKNILIFFLILTSYSFAQNWTTIGTPNFASPGADYIFTCVAPNGEPYVVYRDQNWGKTTVKKFDGNNWLTVGTSDFSAGFVSCTTMAFDTTGIPYVAYMDGEALNKVTVMKFDETNWVTVGVAGFSPSGASFTSIAIDGNGTPTVAFRDFSINYRSSVMKFDGTNWVYVGVPGFSSHGGAGGGVAYTSLAIDAIGTLYIAYSDLNNDFKATVMKFDGSNWIYVGAPGFSAWQSNNTSIVLDSQNSPYVAYADRANGGKATVMKFDGNNWVSVGVPGLSPGAVDYTSLSIDKNDVLYLAFEDHAQCDRASVMKFDGNTWVYLGTAGFSDSAAQFTTIAIDNNNGLLYVAYEDLYSGSTLYPSYNATVMKYDITTEIEDVSIPFSMTVYPNPTSRIITVNMTNNKTKGDFTLRVNNSMGQTIYSEVVKEISASFTKQINLSFLPKGIYFLELNSNTPDSTQKKIEVKKIVIQ